MRSKTRQNAASVAAMLALSADLDFNIEPAERSPFHGRKHTRRRVVGDPRRTDPGAWFDTEPRRSAGRRGGNNK